MGDLRCATRRPGTVHACRRTRARDPLACGRGRFEMISLVPEQIVDSLPSTPWASRQAHPRAGGHR